MKIFTPSILCLLFSIFIFHHVYGQNDAEIAARNYLSQHAPRFGLQQPDLMDVVVTDNYTSKHNLVTHVYLKQRFQGISIERAVVNVNLNDDFILLALNSRFHTNLQNKIEAVTPAISSEHALHIALIHIGFPSHVHQILEEKNNVSQYTLFDQGFEARSPIPVFLVYEPLSDEKLALAWSVDIYTKKADHFWNVKVDAQSGQVLSNTDLIVHCDFGAFPETEVLIGNENCEWDFQKDFSSTEKNGFYDYLVYPVPVESPRHGNRQIVSNPSHPVASPFTWHDTDGLPGAEYSITRGNNVWAKEDALGDNEDSIGVSANGGFFLEFIFPLNLQEEPATNLDAATTNLFYWSNVIHDVWYQYGFDEVSGNFQENNYGRGGLGNDYVQADCQDGSISNNANFFTPAEPDSLNRQPRMQMALWTGPGIGSKFLTVNSPSSAAGVYDATRALFGPELPPGSMPVSGDLVVVNDGSASSASGCSTIINSAELSGKIALIDVGGCSFTDKVQNAQDAGAIGVVVCFTFPGTPVSMGGESMTITIPSVMIAQQLCNTLKSELPGVNVSISKDPDGGPNQLDSDLDNGVIVHEYGHGISNRLVGGPANRDCLHNMEQAGEGWSDWLALMMTMEPGDSGNDSRGIGTYLSLEPQRGPGIRPYPYSNNHFINPHTYRNINTEFAPHGTGSVMAATLWDLSWALIDEYGFDADLYHGSAGNNMAFQLVIDGLKLIPCEPGFVDVRDGILLADSVNYNGANQCLIWSVFAKRGLGFGADQGSTENRSDGIESFLLPPSCIDELTITKTVSSESAEPGDTITFTLTVFNGSDQILTNNIVTDTLPPGVYYIIGSVDCGANFANNVLSIPLGTIAPGSLVECSFKVVVADGFVTNYLFVDNMENGAGNWMPGHALGSMDWELLQVNALSPTHAWFARDDENKTDQLLTLATPVVLTGDDLRLRFAHNFRTEALYDGGVVEISADNGPWQDLGSKIIQNGYAGLLNPDNPMGEREAFWGSSNGYQTTIIDLQEYEGQSVLIRFRFATDGILGNVGWRIDDVQIANEKTIPNTVCITNDQNFDACASVQEPTVVVDPLVVGIEEVELTFDIIVYPNPGTDVINVGMTGNINGRAVMSVYHIDGRLLWLNEVSESALYAHYPINLSEAPSGMYIIKVETKQSILIKKIVLQN